MQDSPRRYDANAALSGNSHQDWSALKSTHLFGFHSKHRLTIRYPVEKPKLPPVIHKKPSGPRYQRKPTLPLKPVSNSIYLVPASLKNKNMPKKSSHNLKKNFLPVIDLVHGRRFSENLHTHRKPIQKQDIRVVKTDLSIPSQTNLNVPLKSALKSSNLKPSTPAPEIPPAKPLPPKYTLDETLKILGIQGTNVLTPDLPESFQYEIIHSRKDSLASTQYTFQEQSKFKKITHKFLSERARKKQIQPKPSMVSMKTPIPAYFGQESFSSSCPYLSSPSDTSSKTSFDLDDDKRNDSMSFMKFGKQKKLDRLNNLLFKDVKSQFSRLSHSIGFSKIKGKLIGV